MEETFCEPCGVHFRPGRKHFYETKHKSRVNACVSEDIAAISDIKDAIEVFPAAGTDLTRHFIHCRYCECREINSAAYSEAFVDNRFARAGAFVELWSST